MSITWFQTDKIKWDTQKKTNTQIIEKNHINKNTSSFKIIQHKKVLILQYSRNKA